MVMPAIVVVFIATTIIALSSVPGGATIFDPALPAPVSVDGPNRHDINLMETPDAPWIR